MNKEVSSLQEDSYKFTTAIDESIQNAMKHRQDTRAAAVIKNIGAITGALRSSEGATKPARKNFERLLFGKNFQGFKSDAKNTFLRMNLEDELQKAKNDNDNKRPANGSGDNGNVYEIEEKKDHIMQHEEDLEANSSYNEVHSFLSRSSDDRLKSKIESELQRVRRASEAEMRAYTNQKENTRRPSLNASQSRSLSADNNIDGPSLSPSAANENPPLIRERKDGDVRRPTPSKIRRPSLTKEQRERALLLAADNTHVTLDRAKEVTKEGPPCLSYAQSWLLVAQYCAFLIQVGSRRSSLGLVL